MATKIRIKLTDDMLKTAQSVSNTAIQTPLNQALKYLNQAMAMAEGSNKETLANVINLVAPMLATKTFGDSASVTAGV